MMTGLNILPRCMRRAARLATFVLAAAGLLACLPPQAQALPIPGPYISLTLSPSPLNLGSVALPGTYDSPAVLNIHFAANCNHGPVIISASALASSSGQIPLSRFHVKVPVGGFYVPLNGPVAVASAGGPDIQNIALRFRVETQLADQAGTYQGTLTLTVAPAP